MIGRLCLGCGGLFTVIFAPYLRYNLFGGSMDIQDAHWVLDFGEWASIYKIWPARQPDYRNELQRRQVQAVR
jgi:hypothetical protein